MLRAISAFALVGSFAAVVAACSSKSSHPHLVVDNGSSNTVKFVFGPSATDSIPWNDFVDGKVAGDGPGRQIAVDAQGTVTLDLPSAGHYRWGALESLPDPAKPGYVSLQLVQDDTFDSDGNSDVTLHVTGKSTVDAGPPPQATCGKATIPPTFHCTDSTFAACSDGHCCAVTKPYWCNSKCYASAADVVAAGCTTTCLACGDAPTTTGTTPTTDGGPPSDGGSGGPKANGSVCFAPGDCASGKCVKNICSCDDAGHSVCPCKSAGAACGDDPECCTLSCGFNSDGFCD